MVCFLIGSFLWLAKQKQLKGWLRLGVNRIEGFEIFPKNKILKVYESDM